jgi:hypothetical protein
MERGQRSEAETLGRDDKVWQKDAWAKAGIEHVVVTSKDRSIFKVSVEMFRPWLATLHVGTALAPLIKDRGTPR